MAFQWQDWVIFVLVPIVAWVLALIGRSRAGVLGSWRGYFLAQGRLGTGTVAAAYVGANITFTSICLLLSEESYNRGWWVLVVPVFWLVGSLFLLALYPRMKSHLLEGRTLHQTLGYAFDSAALQRCASFWTIVSFAGTAGLEFYGGIILMNWAGVSLLKSVTVALSLAYIVSALTVSGGLRGVAYADVFLDLMSLTTLIFLARALFGVVQSPAKAVSSLGASSNHLDPIVFVISAAVLFIPFQVCALDSWQRLLAWKKAPGPPPASWMLGGGLLLAAAYCVPIAVGVRVHEMGITVPPGAHPLGEFLRRMHLEPGLLGLCLAGFAGAMLSSSDELLNCCSLSLLFDFRRLSHDEKDAAAQRRIVFTGKFFTGLFGFVSALLALLALRYQRQLGDLALAVFSAQVVFSWPLAAALFTPRLAPKLKTAALVSMVVAGVVAVAMVLVAWRIHDDNLASGAPVGAFVAAGLLFSPAWLLVKVRSQ